MPSERTDLTLYFGIGKQLRDITAFDIVSKVPGGGEYHVTTELCDTGDLQKLSGAKTQLHIVARVLQLFTDMRSGLQLDAENIHILCAFELAELAQQTRAEGPYKDRHGFSSELSASTVSEMTFIPRQTVRRRLERLCLLGYVSHLGDGRYMGGPKLLDLGLSGRLRRVFPLP